MDAQSFKKEMHFVLFLKLQHALLLGNEYYL